MVVSHQLAVPQAYIIGRVLTSKAAAEVIDHGFERRERHVAVGKDTSSQRFLLARCQHLHRRSSAWMTC